VVAYPSFDLAMPMASPLAPFSARAVVGPTAALVVPAGGTWNDDARPTAEPMRTRTGNETDALVVPLRTHGSAEPAEVSPVPTVVAGNAGHALLIRNYSGGSEMAKPVSAPTGTVTGTDHHSLVLTPFLTDYHGEGNPQPVALPHRTMDTRDRYGLVEPSTSIEDCGFRMLEPHEIGRAMAFDDSYIVLGNKRERVRQYGNAVTPPVMSMLLERAIASLSGEGAA
jgi:DNA (cytosine-5)-methyltransferase 1